MSEEFIQKLENTPRKCQISTTEFSFLQNLNIKQPCPYLSFSHFQRHLFLWRILTYMTEAIKCHKLDKPEAFCSLKFMWLSYMAEFVFVI